MTTSIGPKASTVSLTARSVSAAVVAFSVGEVALGVVILYEAVVDLGELRPAFGLGEVEVRHPALNIEDHPNRIHL
ncbi:MAG: hypothetical protein ACFB50_16780 [Rubrobacteraceae bacterium]